MATKHSATSGHQPVRKTDRSTVARINATIIYNYRTSVCWYVYTRRFDRSSFARCYVGDLDPLAAQSFWSKECSVLLFIRMRIFFISVGGRPRTRVGISKRTPGRKRSEVDSRFTKSEVVRMIRESHYLSVSKKFVKPS